jgi:redox-sensitive bicupin YhaK (pirin superfamily)
MNTLQIESRLTVQALNKGDGFRALGVCAVAAVMDPYLVVDHYQMSQPTFGAHSHAGFSAVTYMFDDEQTGFENRDSLGDHSVIRAGDLHWSTAGAGIVHDEVLLAPGRTAHGLQIFINLAAEKKHMAPGSIHIERERMPTLRQSGSAQVKVAFGAYDDGEHLAPAVAALPNDVTLFDVSLDTDTHFVYPVAADTTAFVLVISGTVQAGQQPLQEGESAVFARTGGVLSLHAARPSRIAMFPGEPLKQPVVRHDPFAMTNRPDIERAIDDYQSGPMGRL